MKIAIFSDPHLGYPRFEEDSYIQAEDAIVSASEKADIILCAGDIFDTKIPKLETLKRAVEIFNKAKKPLVAIHGNHERRTKDSVNPVQLLASGTDIILLHGQPFPFEMDGESIEIFGLGSVPEDYATEAIRATIGRFRPREGALRILMIHQTIQELVPNSGKDELSLDFLESLPFDLIINGHIHERFERLGGRFLIPGSTVITQLKEEQTEPRGYLLFDTKTKTAEFVPIRSRSFRIETIESIDGEDPVSLSGRVVGAVKAVRGLDPECIILVRIRGKMKSGVPLPDLSSLESMRNVFIDNKLESESLQIKLERIRVSMEKSESVKDLALGELRKRTQGRLAIFDAAELFEAMASGSEEGKAYVESRMIETKETKDSDEKES